LILHNQNEAQAPDKSVLFDIERAVDPARRHRLHGGALTTGVLKATEDDFFVEEVLGFKPDGQGNHWALFIEKRGLTTARVVDWLSQTTGTPRRDIGLCGQKDRQAITRQWFTLPIETFDLDTFAAQTPLAGIRVLDITRHGKKLRPGSHQANRFVIKITDIPDLKVRKQQISERLEQIRINGFANYFGMQRYGFAGNNREQLRHFGAPNSRAPKRNQRSWLLSSLRSWIFDTVLDSRLATKQGMQASPGAVCKHIDSNSRFVLEENDLADAEKRLAARTLQLTGPLWGASVQLGGGQSAEWEQAAADCVLTAVGKTTWQKHLHNWKVEPDRRALIAYAPDLSHQINAQQASLTLTFTLPPGSYATELIAEVIAVE